MVGHDLTGSNVNGWNPFVVFQGLPPYGGFALSQGSINGREIHGFALASTSPTGPSSMSPPNVAQASFGAIWRDSIAVGGLAPGAPISIRVTNSLHSDVALNGVASGTSPDVVSAFSVLSLSFPGSPALNPHLSLSNTDANPRPGTQTTSLTITCNSGTGVCFTLDEILNLQAQALGNGVTAQVDASNTNEIFIDVLTPGGTLAAASGVNYSSTSTPEPATGGLLLAGFAAVFTFRRRHARGARK
jgi:hypothetical protein